MIHVILQYMYDFFSLQVFVFTKQRYSIISVYNLYQTTPSRRNGATISVTIVKLYLVSVVSIGWVGLYNFIYMYLHEIMVSTCMQ